MAAAETGVSPDLADDVISFFWRECRSIFKNPQYLAYEFFGFGTFKVRYNQMNILIDKYKGIIKHMKPKTYKAYAILELVKRELAVLENIQDQYNSEYQRKQKVRISQKNGRTV